MTWTGIPVRLRHADYANGKPFGECTADDLEDIVATVHRWGANGFLETSGQFDVEAGCFEVVIHEDGA